MNKSKNSIFELMANSIKKSTDKSDSPTIIPVYNPTPIHLLKAKHVLTKNMPSGVNVNKSDENKCPETMYKEEIFGDSDDENDFIEVNIDDESNKIVISPKKISNRLTTLSNDILDEKNKRDGDNSLPSEAKQLLLQMEGGPLISKSSPLKSTNNKNNTETDFNYIRIKKAKLDPSSEIHTKLSKNNKNDDISFQDTCLKARAQMKNLIEQSKSPESANLSISSSLTSEKKKVVDNSTCVNIRKFGGKDARIAYNIANQPSKSLISKPNSNNVSQNHSRKNSTPILSSINVQPPNLNEYKVYCDGIKFSIDPSVINQYNASLTKIPYNTRQKYLALFHVEYIKALPNIPDRLVNQCKTKDDTMDKLIDNIYHEIKQYAFQAEHDCYVRGKGNKNTYFNLAASHIKAIRGGTAPIPIILASESHQISLDPTLKHKLHRKAVPCSNVDDGFTEETFALNLLPYLMTLVQLRSNGYPYLISFATNEKNEDNTMTQKDSKLYGVCIDPSPRPTDPLSTGIGNRSSANKSPAPPLTNTPHSTTKSGCSAKISIHNDSLILHSLTALDKSKNLNENSNNSLAKHHLQSYTYLHKLTCSRCNKLYEIKELWAKEANENGNKRHCEFKGLNDTFIFNEKQMSKSVTYQHAKPEECLYHWGRLRKIGGTSSKRNATSTLVKYVCCGASVSEPGCTLANLHCTDKALPLYIPTLISNNDSMLTSTSASNKAPCKSWFLNHKQHINEQWKSSTNIFDFNSTSSGQLNLRLLSSNINLCAENAGIMTSMPLIPSTPQELIKLKANTLKVYSLDCEMVYTPLGSEIARITMIGFVGSPNKMYENGDPKLTHTVNGQTPDEFIVSPTSNNHKDVNNKETSLLLLHPFVTVYDVYVRPRIQPIIDYNTRWSGIVENCFDAQNSNLPIVTFEQAQKDVLTLLRGNDPDANQITILLGHSLESDLIGLQIVHPYIVDTALVFPHRLGLPFKRALRNLSVDILKRIIQDDVSGHDSKEDALTCMQLMKQRILSDDPKAFSLA